MLKISFKIGIRCILIAVITCTLLVWLSPIFGEDKSSSAYQLRVLPDDTIDILVLGSSHAQYSVNPGVIYTETGYYSFVMGSGCQPMVMSYYNLEEALKTQHPEIVLLDVFTMMPAQSVCYADGMFYVAGSQLTGKTRVDALSEVDNPEKIQEYIFDIAITHDRWKNDDFGSEDFIDGMMGYVSQPVKDYVFHHLVPFERGNTEVSLKEKDLKYLDKIIDLCNENGIRLILMKAACDIDQENYDTLQAIWDYAEEKNVEYLDFLQLAEEIGFTLGMDGDTWHNNVWGSQKVSRYISNYIVENGYIYNHQTNETLESVLSGLSAVTARWLFVNNVDIYQLIEFAQKYDVSMVIKYTGTKGWTSFSEYENATLQKLGAKFDFIEQKEENYYAFIENGDVIIDGNEPLSVNFNNTEIILDENYIKIGDKEFYNLGELEIIFCGNDFSWFQEMPINYASETFWKRGCDSWNCYE